MTIKATKTRKHPELEVGSRVKVMRNKGISEKEKASHWNQETKTARKIETKLGQKILHFGWRYCWIFEARTIESLDLNTRKISDNDHRNFRERPRKFPRTTTKNSENTSRKGW